MKIVLLLIKWLILLILGITCFWFVVSLLVYRVTWGDQVEYHGEVHYKFLELNITNRQVFEELIGNRIARIEGYTPFYISKEDHAKLWPESPHEMAKKGYTISADLRAKPLFFGGISKAKVILVKNINEPPKISK